MSLLNCLPHVYCLQEFDIWTAPTRANSQLHELIYDPVIQEVLACRPATQPLGLHPGSRSEYLPLVSLLLDEDVREVLSDTPQTTLDTAAAVIFVRDYFLQHPRALYHVCNLRALKMDHNNEIYTGWGLTGWTSEPRVQATAAALALVAARSADTRKALAEQLVPWIQIHQPAWNCGPTINTWRVLNEQLFRSCPWDSQAHAGQSETGRRWWGCFQGGSDVLVQCMGREVVGCYSKKERVVAALMVGLMFRGGVMA